MPDAILRRSFDASLAADLHPLPFVGRVLAARQVSCSSELDLSLAGMLRPDSMCDVERAVDLLVTALQQQTRIVVIGDYDADGASSTALAIHFLRAAGCRQLDWLVPDRFRYGYGLSAAIVELALEDHDATKTLLLTVDNGIASHDGVALARQRGARVVVTDHHLPGDSLPQADAIVNPNRHDDSSAAGNLCGAGVVFYVLAVLCRRLQTSGWFQQRGLTMPRMADYLDLVALATVADVVALDRNNRILVEQGLRRIRAGAARPGLLALFEVGSRDHRNARSEDIGFIVGPRLNAAGRLETMDLGIRCLLADSRAEALPLAKELDDINRRRRSMQQQMQQDALQQVDQLIEQSSATSLPAALSLFHQQWHEGIVGIVAGRLREHTQRPVFAFARGSDGNLKGSGRSIPQVHLRDVLSAIAATEPGMLQKFGGHSTAAGLTLREADLPRFQNALQLRVLQMLGGTVPERQWLTDGALNDEEFSLDNARLLAYLQPWGQGFNAPLFDDQFEITWSRPVGSNHTRLRLRRVGSQRELAAIAFNQQIDSAQSNHWHIVYSLDVNTFGGSESLQLGVRYLRPAE